MTRARALSLSQYYTHHSLPSPAPHPCVSSPPLTSPTTLSFPSPLSPSLCPPSLRMSKASPSHIILAAHACTLAAVQVLRRAEGGEEGGSEREGGGRGREGGRRLVYECVCEHECLCLCYVRACVCVRVHMIISVHMIRISAFFMCMCVCACCCVHLCVCVCVYLLLCAMCA